MKPAFSEINKIPYEGPSSKNPLAFKHYNASEIVEGRTMEEQLRFSVVGLNFDAKVRRESFDPIDLFYAHIGGMDAFARGLKIAAAIRADGRLAELVKNRYASWDTGIGASIEADKENFASLEKYAMSRPDPIQHSSGRQELFENIVNELI